MTEGQLKGGGAGKVEEKPEKERRSGGRAGGGESGSGQRGGHTEQEVRTERPFQPEPQGQVRLRPDGEGEQCWPAAHALKPHPTKVSPTQGKEKIKR